MIHGPVAAHVAKTKIARHDAAAGRIPLERAPSRNGPVVRTRRALGRVLVAIGSRLNDAPVRRPAAAGDPCA
jgi:hypothetical protein